MKFFSMAEKTIFMTVETNMAAKEFLRSDAFPLLLKRGPRVVILVPPDKVEYYKSQYEADDVFIEPLPKVVREGFHLVIKNVAFNSLSTASVWFRIWESYYLRKRPLNLLMRMILWHLGKLRVWRELTRQAEWQMHDDEIWRPMFNKYRPDMVFCTNVIGEADISLMKHARRRGIKILAMIRGWDNLTSKGTIRFKPDHLIVYNNNVKHEAVIYGDMRPDQLTVVGMPHYDSYVNPEFYLKRDEFFQKLGLDPSKKLIVYAMGGNIAVEDPYDHAKMLNDAIERGDIPPAQVLIRAHPKYDMTVSDTSQLKHVKFYQPGKKIAGARGWEFEKEDTVILINTVRWNDVNINSGSTVSLESAMFDKPVVILGFNGYKPVPWHKNVGTGLMFTHYGYILSSGGVWRVNNERELIEACRAYLQDPSIHKEGRKRLVESVAGELDGKSGERLANAISAMLFA